MADKKHIVDNAIKHNRNVNFASMEGVIYQLTWSMLHKAYSNEPSIFGLRMACRMGISFYELEEYAKPITHRYKGRD